MQNNDSWKNVLAQARQDSPLHASIPFWSWNDTLQPDLLQKQMEDMKALGMRGFFMHARGGLETEYLSRDWFDAIRYCVEEGTRLGLEAWAYDENGWPSGFGGGLLLQDPANHACYLTLEHTAQYPAPAKDLLGVYIREDGAVRRIRDPEPAEEYLAVRWKRESSYVDVLNPAVARQFTQAIHARYQTELGKDFGSRMPGFFTDEPQYYRYATPWSPILPEAFRAKYGYEVPELLPALFLELKGAEKFRYDYYLLCHEMFYRNFMEPLYRWCGENGIQLTGHGIEEWTLAGQMMCCGGVMPFYLYEHIPGIDYLRRAVRNAAGSRQLGSVCAQTGKKVALSEMFAACGWDVTPKELKRIADLQFAGGVNLICEHLYAYSSRGQRKNDYPHHYSEHSPWHRDYRLFEEHYKHLGAALSQGEEVAETLVIHPIRSAYLHYKRQEHPGCVARQDADFRAFVDDFSFRQIPYHFGDEGILATMGSVEGKCIRVGRCAYSTVVLPNCETLASSTVSLLAEFLRNGGKLHIYGSAPTRVDGAEAELSFLQSNLTLEQLRDTCGIRVAREGKDVPLHMQVRRTDAGRLIFLANTSENSFDGVTVTVADAEGFSLLRPEDLSLHPVRGRKNPDGSVTLLLDFDDSASFLLAETGAEMAPFLPTQAAPLMELPDFVPAEPPENVLLLDKAALSLDGGPFTEERPISRIRDELLQSRFSGTVALRFRFHTEFLPRQLLLITEPLKGLSVTVNGVPADFLPGWRLDRRNLTADLAPLTRVGENTVILTFPYFQREEVYGVLFGTGTETLRNSLSFDTEVENCWLFGDFDVRSRTPFLPGERGTLRTEGGFVLTPRNPAPDFRNPVADGYPFFAGEISGSCVLTWREGDPTRLKLGGRFAVCRLEVNGEALPVDLFSDKFELAPLLKEGENLLRLTLCFSNRNLMGPHHRRDPEPASASPSTFSYEKQWKNGRCEDYLDSYAFVRFGIGF